MVTATAYLVIFPTADARMGEIELAISGVYLTREAAEEQLDRCQEEYDSYADAEDEGWESPYIIEMPLG